MAKTSQEVLRLLCIRTQIFYIIFRLTRPISKREKWGRKFKIISSHWSQADLSQSVGTDHLCYLTIKMTGTDQGLKTVILNSKNTTGQILWFWSSMSRSFWTIKMSGWLVAMFLYPEETRCCLWSFNKWAILCPSVSRPMKTHSLVLQHFWLVSIVLWRSSLR